MNETITVPIWYFLLHFLLLFLLMLLDSWRAKVWARFLKEVNKLLRENRNEEPDK